MRLFKKVKKLSANPNAFWDDSIFNLRAPRLVGNDGGKTVAFAFKVNHWKREFIEKNYPEYEWNFVPFKKTAKSIEKKIKLAGDKVFVIWGYNELEGTADYARKNKIPVYRMEDGFVRSVGLGANHELPLSLVLDKSGTLYYDSSSPSTLENILNNYDFSSDTELMKRAQACLDELIDGRVSKYNHVAGKSAEAVYSKYCQRADEVKRILVIGQVEDDASIKYGGGQGLSNGSLVSQARQDYPDAQIFFKPHPDILSGKRDVLTPMSEISKLAYVVTEPLSLIDSFETIDEVYTLTSLSGFEAVLRDIPVTTMGKPFYSGWGLTNDMQDMPRRKRKLNKLEVFAAAYILYPSYFDVEESCQSNLVTVIEKLKFTIENPKNMEKYVNGSVIDQQFYCFGENWDCGKKLPIAFVFGVLPWKRKYITALLDDYRAAYRFGGHKYDKIEEAIKNNPSSEVFVWGYKENDKLKAIFNTYGKKIKRLEDGFVAGVGLGVDTAIPDEFWAPSAASYTDRS